MNPHLKKGEDKKKPTYEVSTWQTVAPMKNKRAAFGAVVVNNEIYVFGGISGKEGTHKPILAQNVVEKYNPSTNEWTEVKIDGLTPRAAFAFTSISNNRIAVFGGTDGTIIVNDLIFVDFAKGEA